MVRISFSTKLYIHRTFGKLKIFKMVLYIKKNEKKQMYGGLTAIHLSLICLTVRLGWTDCHTLGSYLYDSKAWVD